MDYDAFRTHYFVDPAPEQGFGFARIYGVMLYFEEYEEAVNFYRKVLGPPAYSEGEYARGWHLGNTWPTGSRGLPSPSR